MSLRYLSYFSVYALQRFCLPSSIHSKYINVEVLQRYLPVGGVRIEDELLITPKGYENLTTAPKGDAMLEIIQQGNSNELLCTARSPSLRSINNKEQPAMVRAPGISTEKPESMLKPLARAATMPAEFKQRKSVDFELRNVPSSFSNSKRSLTTHERIQQWHQDRGLAVNPRNQSHARNSCASVCGESSKGVKHVYLVSDFRGATTPYPSSFEHPLPPCKKCTILCETLDRLRQNLSLSEQSSLSPGAQPQFVATNQKPYLEDVRSKSISPGKRTQQSYNNVTRSQQQERSVKPSVTCDVQRSPESMSRQDKTYPILENEQISLHKHWSVPSLGLQVSEGDSPHDISERTSQIEKATGACTYGRLAYISLPDEPKPENEVCVAEATAAKERVATEEQYYLRRQVDKTQHEARQVLDSAFRSSPTLDQVAQGEQKLYDLIVQTQKTSLDGEGCCLGTEQRNSSLVSTAIRKTQAENTRPLPEPKSCTRSYGRFGYATCDVHAVFSDDGASFATGSR
jgi:hypothetical protein